MVRLLDIFLAAFIGAVTTFPACAAGPIRHNGGGPVLPPPLRAKGGAPELTWTQYHAEIESMAKYFGGRPVTINVGKTWYDTLQIPDSDFATRTDTFSVSGNPLNQAATGGTNMSLSGDKQIVFVSGWVDGTPNAGSAFAMKYTQDVPTELDYFPIEGAQLVWVLGNSDGSQSVLFVGVDEGKQGNPNTPLSNSPCYVYDVNSGTLKATSFLTESHNSVPFDLNGDGNIDIIAQSYGGAPTVIINEGNGKFKNQLLGSNATGLGSGLAVTPVGAGWQSNGTFQLAVTDGAPLPGFAIPIQTNYVLTFSHNLKSVVSAQVLPQPYFEAPVFNGVDLANPDWVGGGPGRSNDQSVRSFDFNGDGLPDLLVGSIIYSTNQPYEVLQFLISHNGTFVDETASRLFNWLMIGPGVHRIDYVDVNGDGFPDILITDYIPADLPEMKGQTPVALTTPAQVLLNDGTGHFVSVIHQQINDTNDGDISEFVWSMDAEGRLKWTSINPNGTSEVQVVTRTLSIALSTGPNGSNPAWRGAPGFNEFYYLLKYPNVAALVRDGVYSSGLDHYLKVGRLAGYRAFAPNATVRGVGDFGAVDFQHPVSNYVVSMTGRHTVTIADKYPKRDGTTTLINVGRANFTDTSMSLYSQISPPPHI
jgi:hypothetical protein